tara:strand:+ start:785 stop:1288 length:504 start_codon:yes stop_codon:yes gene_type:complete
LKNKEPEGLNINTYRIAEVSLDQRSVVRWNPEIDRERKVAIYDLLEENYFQPASKIAGPFKLILGIEENRLVFSLKNSEDPASEERILLPMSGLRRVVKDYFTVCESYHNAIKYARPNRIEALDVGRKGLHDEGSQLLLETLKGKAEIDFGTARRLFTLICVMQLRS